MMNSIRTGVIGVGRMGQHHCRIYSTLRHTRLAGIYDPDPKAGAHMAQRFEVPVFPSVDALLAEVDAVSIAAPTPAHHELVLRCLQAGVHVLVEKPVTETIEQAEDLLRAVQASRLVVQVGHIERFNPTYQELKNVLAGFNVLAVNFRRLSPYRGSNKDVDVVLDLMVHDLDLVLDLFQREPDRVSAFGLAPFSPGLDHVVAELWYGDGRLVTLTASRVTEQKVRTVEVTAEDAYLEADFLNKSIAVHRQSSAGYFGQNQGGVKYRQESIIERILVPNAEPLLLEIQHFLQCISEGCTPCVSLQDGLRALRMTGIIHEMVAQQAGLEAAGSRAAVGRA
jgi:predicted dehydrogenase